MQYGHNKLHKNIQAALRFKTAGAQYEMALRAPSSPPPPGQRVSLSLLSNPLQLQQKRRTYRNKHETKSNLHSGNMCHYFHCLSFDDRLLKCGF
jgi:hypothetical protein